MDNSLKAIIVGESGVGKTSIILRVADNKFLTNILSTQAVDFRLVKMQIEGQNVKLKIWDTAGQEKFRSLAQSYFNGAQGALVVFSVNSLDSFSQVRYWLDSLREKVPSITIALIGNKIDLPRTVNREDAENLAKEYNIRYFEVCCKDGTNISEAFEVFSTDVFKRIKTEGTKNTTPPPKEVTLKDEPQSTPKEKGCKC